MTPTRHEDGVTAPRFQTAGTPAGINNYYKTMMKHFIKALLPLLFLAFTATAQVRFEERDSDAVVADSLLIDSVLPELQSLPWPQSVVTGIDNLLQSDMFHTSQVGLMVYDLDADSAIYCHNERQLLRPASTMKLITAIAAIDKLGGSYQFKTELCYTGVVADSTLAGDIYCVGGFDPRFNNDDMRAFVEAIRKMGVDTIRGNIYADKTMKEKTLYGEGWCWDDDNPRLSPLLVGRKDVFIDRFIKELREAGIVVSVFTGQRRRPADAFCICRRFHTIDQVLIRMLKESDNLFAESMFYQIGAATGAHPATASNARNVINQLIEKVGLDPQSYNIADGSGLSLYNYVTAELEVRLLRYAFINNNIYLHLHPSLPQAGVDGTLRKRMTSPFTQGNVHAKTGSVSGISSLAGYCTAANGHRLAFAIINQGLLHGRNGRAFQDKVCTILCQP